MCTYESKWPDTNPCRAPKADSIASASTADGYYEGSPTELEWVREQIPSREDIASYVRSLFPFTHWITRYNLQWFMGDLIAGKYDNTEK